MVYREKIQKYLRLDKEKEEIPVEVEEKTEDAIEPNVEEKSQYNFYDDDDFAAGVGLHLLDDVMKDNGKDYVLESRKAFVNFINNGAPDLIDKISDIEEIKNIKLHQLFSREYLSNESPYRGLLIYHGLGTGKTATSIITAEGLSKDMNINVLLPSLETEYINEIKSWGDDIFNINNNVWEFVDEDELNKNREKYDYIPSVIKYN